MDGTGVDVDSFVTGVLLANVFEVAVTVAVG
jgi:hypothetical protein